MNLELLPAIQLETFIFVTYFQNSVHSTVCLILSIMYLGNFFTYMMDIIISSAGSNALLKV